MTNKEYRAKLEKIDVYSGYDCLSRDEVKELRRDAKVRAELNYEIYMSGFRATIRLEYHGMVLRSYYTDVAYFDHDGKFHKTWDGYSATTLKHINMFRKRSGLAPLSKREWVEMEMY